jgi:hypothetical protein
LREEYARSRGYDPKGSWILIVHADDSTEFYRFDDPSQMWCCQYQQQIGRMLADEVRARSGAS